MPPAAGRERGVIKLIKCTTTPAGFFVSYDYAFISPDSGPESPDVFLHATDVGGLGRSICEGDTVEYCVVDYKGRRKAVDVVKVLTSVKYLVPILRPIDAAAASAGSGFEPDADADAARPAPSRLPPSVGGQPSGLLQGQDCQVARRHGKPRFPLRLLTQSFS